jgi:flagellar basal body-associated protein FliL
MLEELRSLSDAKKKQVIIVSTIIIMIIIIGVWVAYFNSVIMGTTQQATAQATSTTADVVPAPTAAPTPSPTVAQANGPSLWQNIEDGFGSIINVFKGPSQYNIQPQSNQ